MSRDAMFDAVRPFAPGQKFTPAMVAAGDAFADALGLPREGTAANVDPELLAQLAIDEGCRLKAYLDTVGVWTAGYGHAHVAPGTVWTQAQADAQLRIDAAEHNARLAKHLPWIAQLDPVRRRVLQNMHFNMGWDDVRTSAKEGLSGFVNTLEHVRAGRYGQAADGMLASKWAKQVGQRAVRLAKQMRDGR